MENWISTKHGIPSDRDKVWFWTPKWGLMQGRFYWEDAFGRKNMFVKSDGGHIPIEEVTHYQELIEPEPPR